MAERLPELEAVLRGNIGDFEQKMGKADATIDKLEKSGSGKFDKLAKVGKVAFLALSGAAVAFGVKAVKAAMEGEKAHAQLEVAISNTGKSIKDFQKPIDQLIVKWERYGAENDEVEKALTRLTQATGDTQKAMDHMQLVVDIAKARNIDYQASADLVAKVLSGNTALLGRMGIATDLTSGKMVTQEKAAEELKAAQEELASVQEKVRKGQLGGAKAAEALKKANERVRKAQADLTEAQQAGAKGIELLRGKFKGAADKEAATFAGKVAALRAKMANLTETVGNKLIPVIIKVANVVIGVIRWLGKHKEVAIALAVVIGGVLVFAIGAWAASMYAAAAAAIAANAASGGIALAIAALITGILLLAKHWKAIWEGIKKVVEPVLDFIKGAFSGVVDFLKKNWPYIAAIILLPFAPIILAFTKFRKTTVAIFGAVKDAIVGAFKGAWEFVKNLWQGAIEVIKAPFNLLIKGINFVIRGLNKIHFKIPSWVPGIGGKGFGISIPEVPSLARGGIVPATPGGQLVRVAEAGLAEKIVPLRRGERGGGDGDVYVSVFVEGSVIRERELVKAVRDELLVLKRRNIDAGLA